MRHERELVAGTPLALAACLVLVASHGRQLASIAASSDRLPQWDMAKYAVSGQRLASALADLDVARFLVEIHGLSVWPPVYPLLEVPVIWWGDGFAALRLLQTGLWSLMVLATWWALHRGGRRAAVAGLAAASAVASAPLIAALATVNMLEVPGLLLLALCLGAYLRAISAATWRQEERWWRATWLFSLALFLCKYNYGLLWLLPVGLSEARRRVSSWSQALRSISARLGARLDVAGLVRPWPLFVLSMLALIVVIRRTGGIELDISGVQVSLTSPGGPAQVLYVACWLRWLLPWRRFRERWRRLGRLPAADRLFVRCFALPAALWLLPPPHLKDFLYFLDNRDDGPATGTWEWLAYYPRELLTAYGSPWLGLALVALVALAVSAALRRSFAVAGRGPGEDDARWRIVGLGCLVSAAAILLHPYKLPRFAVFLWWWLALAAALGLVALARRLSPGTALGAGLLLPLSVAWGGVDLGRISAEHEMRTVPAETREVLAAALAADGDGALRSASEHAVTRRGPRTTLVGTWNELSPHLLEWWARRLGLPDGWVQSDFDIARREPGRLISRLEAKGSEAPVFERVVVLEKEGDGAFAREVEWLEPVRSWLRAGAYYRLDESVEVGGYRLLFYVPLSPPSRPPDDSPSRPLASSSAKAAS